ncbi:phenazine biosynthesis FMN-dependent oxidase PhzG [Micromonospora sp. NPDC049523]|uniref:phenazine biosynthesis FMN-dependent oxidase PhzG n=1 Tax=Micromonospora sp. NPDC049523 TaxID=3155921 RepID=UPI0034487033
MAESLTGDATLRLAEFDTPPADPLPLLREWLDAAVDAAVREPGAMVLATADSDGRVSSRVVLLKELRPSGLVFTTHHASRKGRDLAARPYGSATFYWRERLQQVNVAGPVQPLNSAESDALFAERPEAAKATTAASRQGDPLDDEGHLRQRAADLLAAGTPIDRPPGWGGYVLRPAAVEFWYGSPDRLHRRLRYEHDGRTWSYQRLQP